VSQERPSASPTAYAATLEGVVKNLRPAPALPAKALSGFDVEIPPELLAKIQAAMEEAIEEGIVDGTRRIESRYKGVETWGKVQVVATIVAAAAAVGILAVLIWKR